MRREKNKYDWEAAAGWNLPPSGQPATTPHARRYELSAEKTPPVSEKQRNSEHS